ncbi:MULTISPECIES: restriction endonuclease subunit S [Acinetobacter]|uniref:Type I restriction endonuclease n=1 Tax=Acinetobacter nosocomialis TaxID=106654 RepID=A0AB36M050_ACINO|nr:MULTISPECIES: restriction endonuclease subunit S [Acinetobacter]MCH7306218.1 restriction endonuclease subunit S [Acinetobacter higginsii]MEB3794660.1 restriction endonuclease subunit S [Acinetobacter sp. IK24]MEB3813934.1 restriction endonuclease subunit S [Acinetobacter sp. IK22]MEB3832964.1 restriction endonuclease subunit S [Acinetobacter sp. IK23]MEB3836311.1 restriction endonuclease subunit S [Acinetobacter sp. IK25]
MKFKQYSFKELLSNIVDNRGKTCPTVDQGLPLIATNCINNNSLFPVFEKVRYVNLETYKNWFRGHPQPDDIIFVCKGSPGRVAWVKDPVGFCIAQDMVSIRADKTKVDPKYLFALLRSDNVQQKISNMHVGSLIPHFKKGDFGNLYLDISEDMEYQRMVGEIYFNFSMKIEQNNQINQTLESIAQAIFKSWFINFEPVRAKITAKQTGQDPEFAAMCAISGKSEAELEQMAKEDFAELQATAALFPDELVETELGDVPKGWELQQLKDIAKYSSNKILLNDLNLENYISTENMLPEKKGIEKASSLPKANSVPAFRQGNILVSNIRPYFKKIWFSFFDGGHSNDVLNFDVLEKGTEEYLYNLIYQDSFFDRMMASSKGSKMPRGDKKAIMDFQIIVPPISLRCLYSAKVRSFYFYQNKLKIENQTLIDLRDTLLPRLLSGEVDLLDLHGERD